jgi:hypothetical protein
MLFPASDEHCYAALRIFPPGFKAHIYKLATDNERQKFHKRVWWNGVWLFKRLVPWTEANIFV